MGSSKNFNIDTSSLRPFLLLVLIMNSLARYGAGAGSKGLKIIDLSRGSPGNNDHWSNMLKQNA